MKGERDMGAVGARPGKGSANLDPRQPSSHLPGVVMP